MLMDMHNYFFIYDSDDLAPINYRVLIYTFISNLFKNICFVLFKLILLFIYHFPFLYKLLKSVSHLFVIYLAFVFFKFQIHCLMTSWHMHLFRKGFLF